MRDKIDRMQTAPSYRHVSWCYDAIASAYSLGAIDRAKQLHCEWVKPGMRVLYAGAGNGREIVEACQRGAEVTCVEPCPAMAERLHQRLGRDSERFTIVPRPIQSVHAKAEYDMVVGHFFLNVFDPQSMPDVLERLAGMVRPGGRIVIADFKPAKPQTGILDRALRKFYYRPINLAGRLLRICALHPIYDYAPLLLEQGFKIEINRGFRLLPGTPDLYHTLIARPPAGQPA